jgi:hypothetical protein
MCWRRAVASLSGGGTESGFKWGNVRLTWTVGMAAAAAELSVMTSSRDETDPTSNPGAKEGVNSYV